MINPLLPLLSPHHPLPLLFLLSPSLPTTRVESGKRMYTWRLSNERQSLVSNAAFAVNLQFVIVRLKSTQPSLIGLTQLGTLNKQSIKLQTYIGSLIGCVEFEKRKRPEGPPLEGCQSRGEVYIISVIILYRPTQQISTYNIAYISKGSYYLLPIYKAHSASWGTSVAMTYQSYQWHSHQWWFCLVFYLRY